MLRYNLQIYIKYSGTSAPTRSKRPFGSLPGYVPLPIRREQPEMYYYTDHGGWEGTGWNGVHRLYFVFSDTLVVGGHLNPRFGEGYIQELAEADLAKRLPTAFFAGIVCVRDWAGPAVCSRSRNAATIVTHGTKSRSLDN